MSSAKPSTVAPSTEAATSTLERMAEIAILAGRCEAQERMTMRAINREQPDVAEMHARRASRLAYLASDKAAECHLSASTDEKRNGHLIRLAYRSSKDANHSANMAASYIVADTVHGS